MSDATAQKTVNNPAVTPAQGRSKRLLWFGLLIAALLIGAVFVFAYHNIRTANRAQEEEIENRQRTLTSTRAETVDVWLNLVVETADRLATSSMFQIFSTEVANLDGGLPMLFQSDEPTDDTEGGSGDNAGRLNSQLPLMRNMLSDFVAANKFSSARIVNSKADSYLSTEATMSALTMAQKRLVEKVVSTGEKVFAPLETLSSGMSMSLYIPIMPPRYQQESKRPVAVVIINIPMDGKLSEFLSPGIVQEEGRSVKLVQRNGDIFQNAQRDKFALQTVDVFPVSESDNTLPFEKRKSFGENKTVYSSATKVRSTDWWIVAEHDASFVAETTAQSSLTTYILAGLISALLVLLVIAVWWRLVGKEQCAINEQITDLVALLDDQKKLLDGINSTITDPISLTDGKGIYKYVNKAFAQAVGRADDDVVGLDGPAVFGFDTARRLNATDQHVLMTGESVSINEVIWLQSKRYNFQISKAPLRDAGNRTPQGIVSVFRDITLLVETEERSRRMVQQTIDALVRTIEEADPFLGGHSRIMGGIAALLAKQLRLADTDTATIEAAANLSQIGKMFVPREVLLKPGALTPDEKIEMERHVDHARNVLKDIEFDLPVVEAIYQMNERLDGKGYPKGLNASEISVHAKVLAVANAFTAMAKPRSYRPALPVTEVLAILEKQSESYDQDIVAALRQVIATPGGERLVQQAASAKAI